MRGEDCKCADPMPVLVDGKPVCNACGGRVKDMGRDPVITEELDRRKREREEAEQAAERDRQRRERELNIATNLIGMTCEVNGKTFATVLIETRKCSGCGATVPLPQLQDLRDVLPFYLHAPYNLEGQMERSGWKPIGYRRIGDPDETLCQECTDLGKRTFTCAHCRHERTVDKIHEAFGDGDDAVCEPCYETIPAKEFDAVVARLREARRYDYD